MGIDKFYVGGEINWVMVLEDLDSNDNIPEKAKVLKEIINHEAKKQSETYYEHGWSACKVVNKKTKRLGTKRIKDAVLQDDFAVVPVREWVEWYASLMDEIRFINDNNDSECCKDAMSLVATKMENSLGDITIDRRILFSKVDPVYNAEYIKKEKDDEEMQ